MALTQCGNHVDSTLSPPTLEGMEALSPLIPPIGVIVAVIHACFIDIDNRLLCFGGQLLDEFLPFGFIAFAVAVGLFFRVKPIFFNAREMVRALMSPSHSAAIST
jgi:hypothetical protein